MTCLVIFSGGLDSTVLIALALQSYSHCTAISFDYGQRHRVELEASKDIAEFYGIEHHVFPIDTRALYNSSLLKSQIIPVPKSRSIEEIHSQGTPSTYVPARNTLFLSYAAAIAEVNESQAIFFGANAADHWYVDCREEYLMAMQGVLNLATKQAVLGHPPKLVTPLLHWDKPRIIQEGASLNAPLHLTLSCYDPIEKGRHCGLCDACSLRKEGFLNAGIKDPSIYGY